MRKLALLLILLTSLAMRANDGTLALSPAVVMLRGDHGQSTTQTLRIVNSTSRTFSFDLIAEDVVARDGERIFVAAGMMPGSIAATAVFSQPHLDVPAGETMAVNITVTLPPSTPQRAIRALFKGTNRVMSGKVPMLASLGALLTFSVSDEAVLSAEPLVLRPQSATSNLGASHVCKNAGTEPLVAKGVMAILNAQGALVGRTSLQPHRLLPGESAQLGGEYAGELDPGKYRVLITYDYEGQTLTRSAELEIP
ncbi:MAG TPA: hypothetical protein VGQ76_13780 [Thermoanaerobaculia bacterium]|jgi:hypothetical protein|nr:hypothetical protein [Thermoanaerobaculia bacterium]